VSDEDEDPKKKNLPANLVRMQQNLQAAATSTGSGRGGGNFMKIDDRSGAVVAGPNRDPVPLKARYVVGLHTFSHGYLVFGGNDD
jgi:hypothetical protein